MKSNKCVYEVRWARVEEWSPAIVMVWKTFLRFEADDYTQEGIDNFKEFITSETIYQSFLKGRYKMLVALDGDMVIGVATIRNHNYLSLLFVDEAYHHRGVGRSLIDELCRYLHDEVGERYMALRAAPYAVNFYRRLGFRAVAPEEEIGGIRVTAMEKYF